MTRTPASLLERLRQPAAAAAWSRFVAMYTPLLYHWARQVGLQADDAADLVQDVLTVLVQKLPEFTYDPQRSFRAWLRTVTLNRWRNRCRQAAPAGRLPEDLAGPDAALDLEEQEYRRLLVDRALALMRADFEPPTWQAFWACVVEGRPAVEVAAEQGTSPGAVRAAKFRVLCRLRAELHGLLD